MTIKRHKIFLILLLHSTSKCNASIKDLGRSNDKKEACLRLAELFYAQRKFSAAEKTIKETLGGYNLRDKRECLLLSNIYYEQGRYDAALDVMEDYIKNNPKDPGAIFNLGKIYYMQGRNDPKTREGNFKQAIRKFEESLLYVDSDNLYFKGEIYSYLAQVYFIQKENKLARKMMENALKFRPNDKSFLQFINVISESSLSPEENEIFKKQLFYNLGHIIDLCHLYNVKIILLNYPCEYQDSIKREIANKYGAPFIDIGSRFAELLSNKYNYNDLLCNDSHPNANGYRVIAETVFEALKRQIEILR